MNTLSTPMSKSKGSIAICQHLVQDRDIHPILWKGEGRSQLNTRQIVQDESVLDLNRVPLYGVPALGGERNLEGVAVMLIGAMLPNLAIEIE